jgi:hypothetical protein
MPKKQAEGGKHSARSRAKGGRLTAALEHEAILDDELGGLLCLLASGKPECKEAVIKTRPLLQSKKEKKKTDEEQPEAAKAVTETKEEVPDCWEDLVADEVRDMQRSGAPITVIDVGAGYGGLVKALARPAPTHCLCPVVLPVDVNRRFPPQYTPTGAVEGVTATAKQESSEDTHVTVCSHRLSECDCRFPEWGVSSGAQTSQPKTANRWLGLCDESLYYLSADDLGRFCPGDKLIARLNVATTCGGTRNVTYEVRAGWGSAYMRTVMRKRPWEVYCHRAGCDYLKGMLIRPETHPAGGLFAYPKLLHQKDNKVVVVFGFTTRRCGASEVVVSDNPPPWKMQDSEFWEKLGPLVEAACGGLKPLDEPKIVPIEGKHSTPVPTDSDMLGPKPKPSAEPLSAVAGGEDPTPPPPKTSQAHPEQKTDDPPKEGQEDEIRGFVRARLASQGVKSSTGMLHDVMAATVRKFTQMPADVISRIIESELALVRDAQLKLAAVATLEAPLVGVISGKEPTIGQRMVTTLRNDGKGRGNGKVVRSLWNRKVALPAQEAVTVVAAHDSVLPPGQTIIRC